MNKLATQFNSVHSHLPAEPSVIEANSNKVYDSAKPSEKEQAIEILKEKLVDDRDKAKKIEVTITIETAPMMNDSIYAPS